MIIALIVIGTVVVLLSALYVTFVYAWYKKLSWFKKTMVLSSIYHTHISTKNFFVKHATKFLLNTLV